MTLGSPLTLCFAFHLEIVVAFFFFLKSFRSHTEAASTPQPKKHKRSPSAAAPSPRTSLAVVARLFAATILNTAVAAPNALAFRAQLAECQVRAQEDRVCLSACVEARQRLALNDESLTVNVPCLTRADACRGSAAHKACRGGGWWPAALPRHRRRTVRLSNNLSLSGSQIFFCAA
jgi:hypothetical protein